MATTGSTSGVTTLDSTYTSLINYQIQLESAPLTRLQNQQTALKLQRAIYTDLKTKLDSLRTAAKTLISTDAFYSLKAGRTVSVSDVATGFTVISAAASSYAVASTYEIGGVEGNPGISLALADRVRSDEQEYSDQALSKTGDVFIGGSENRGVESDYQGINHFGNAALVGENTKLADGSYTVETRKTEENVWQFRLVNASGIEQTIDGSGTDGWQAIPTGGGTYNSGRGLTIDFGDDPLKYVAADRTNKIAANVTIKDQNDVLSVSSYLNTVSNFAIDETIADGQLELGNGTYYVETQKNSSGDWQFRLVDSEGTAAKIAVVGGTTYTNSWQNIPTDGGNYSTGRGLSIEFGTDAELYAAKSKLGGATSIDYQAKGAKVAITSDMSLNDIASAINSGTFASGNEVVATVVNRQLLLSSKLTGESHKLQVSGQVLKDLGVLTESGGFKNIMQEARNATFTVNGLAISRSQNSALTDVISGVTLNLTSDAQGKTATLNIASDNTTSKNAINSFITNFNAVGSYLSAKLATTKQTDGTYTRGGLAGDQSILNLRSSLLSMFNSSDPTATVYKSMRDIGITINSSLTMSISDSTKLEAALKTNFADVQKLVDRVMTTMNDKLTRYTSGTASYVDQLIKANTSKTTFLTTQITTMNKRLDQRKITLTNMYVDAQAQMDVLTNTQSTNTAWINSLYSSIYT